MQTFTSVLPALTLFAYSTLAWLPDCAWNDCVSSWDGTSCSASSGWDCVCSDSTAIEKINSCVSSSCTNASDASAIYQAIAQICANAGASVTANPEVTFSATSGGSAWPTITNGPHGGPWGASGSGWSSWVSACSTALPGPPGGWSSGGGPWGGPGNGWNSRGPWGGPNCAWSTWTAGWGPFSSWTGTWSGCSSTTATPSPATVTTTISGQVLTGTTFGIQAVQTAVATTITPGNAAPHITGVGAPGALAVAIIGAALAL